MNSSAFIKKIVLGLATVSVAGFIAYAAQPAATANDSSPLAPLASLTLHEWDAQLPDSPDGKKVSIHARFTWSENKHAILISNQFVVDGKAQPYIDGLYAWNPEKKAIVFTYVGAEGDLSEGTVTDEDGVLVHNFRQIHAADGKTEEFVARVTPHGSEGWDNAIFARKGDALTKIVQVEYRPSR